MNDTVKLLKECSSGCKMAINSMNEMLMDMTKGPLVDVIYTARESHEKLETEIAQQLAKEGACMEEPAMLASAFSWTMSKLKLMMQNDENQVAKLMMDGCNMGIQSITEKIHEYSEASQESKSLANDLVRHEEDFMDQLKQYL